MSFVIGPRSISLVFLPLVFMAFNDDCLTTCMELVVDLWRIHASVVLSTYLCVRQAGFRLSISIINASGPR